MGGVDLGQRGGCAGGALSATEKALREICLYDEYLIAAVNRQVGR
jgi:hypothetical protein